eukprot:jgi/Psemu1/25055/gm1.25055_g
MVFEFGVWDNLLHIEDTSKALSHCIRRRSLKSQGEESTEAIKAAHQCAYRRLANSKQVMKEDKGKDVKNSPTFTKNLIDLWAVDKHAPHLDFRNEENRVKFQDVMESFKEWFQGHDMEAGQDKAIWKKGVKACANAQQCSCQWNWNKAWLYLECGNIYAVNSSHEASYCSQQFNEGHSWKLGPQGSNAGCILELQGISQLSFRAKKDGHGRLTSTRIQSLGLCGQLDN